MMLCIDNFTIIGDADDLVEFLKKYNTQTFVTGNIGDLYNHSTCNIPGTESSPEILNDVVLNDLVCYYEGRPIKSMSDEEIKEAIHIITSRIDKPDNLDDLSHEELVSLLINYAPTSFGHL